MEACEFISVFCRETKANYSSHVSSLISAVLLRFNDSKIEIISAAWGALDGIVKSIKKEDYPHFIPIVRKALKQFLVPPIVELQGFSLPKVNNNKKAFFFKNKKKKN